MPNQYLSTTHCKRGHARIPDNMNKRGGCKLCAVIRKAEWTAIHPGAQRVIDQKYKRQQTGWTQERFENAMREQGGRCANALCNALLIVGGPNREARCCEDHDHDAAIPTPRGLLCNRCNRLLGHFENDLECVGGLLAYLGKYGKSRVCVQHRAIDCTWCLATGGEGYC
jgi:hypothetical protein